MLRASLSGAILTEGEVEPPVEQVFDGPVGSGDVDHALRIELGREQVRADDQLQKIMPRVLRPRIGTSPKQSEKLSTAPPLLRRRRSPRGAST